LRRDIFNSFGNFDVSLESSMDYDLWLRIFPKTRWKFFDRLICNYMVRKGAVSSDIRRKERNLAFLEKVQKRYLGNFELLVVKFFNIFISYVGKSWC